MIRVRVGIVEEGVHRGLVGASPEWINLTKWAFNKAEETDGAGPLASAVYGEIDAELARFGASRSWSSRPPAGELDLLFPDSEQLTAFRMTWG